MPEIFAQRSTDFHIKLPFTPYVSESFKVILEKFFLILFHKLDVTNYRDYSIIFYSRSPGTQTLKDIWGR